MGSVTSGQKRRPLWRDPARWEHSRLIRLLAPAVLYLAIREVGLLVVQWMAGRNRISVTGALTAWDGQWYLSISASGYDKVPFSLVDAFGRRSEETPLAFFPGYPMLVRAAGELPGVSLVAAAFAVNVIGGLVCAYGLVRLGERIGGSWRCGLVLLVLFAASPMSVVLSMTYSEALFSALAVWTLLWLVDREWLLAALGCATAGLVRPTSAALVAAVMLAALVAVIRRRDGWRPWVTLALAPAGLLGYLTWVGARTGRWDGWLALQARGWDSQFDGGLATLRFSLDVLSSARSVLEVATVWILLLTLVLFALGLHQRLPWPLMVYSAGVMFLSIGSNGLMNSKARLLVPAMALLIPAAVLLARRRPGTMVVALGLLLLFGSWFGAYSITAWPYAI
ncbi:MULTISPECIES: hypothetical protein [unclassified Crossiella]|uniref:hypothetical protein n=1 Tax=unclassified Crossiella TaxID=2620835 RepID=UPI001FFE91F9|nr:MULTISPECIES: hypothetical protein [unclassified Crossiella]MCK2237617.1 hypothetical protein [Crossiella sp. S99.2]MCK2254903.1 hypothetical protein [Crossiella sp. S99.1]